MGWWQWWSLSSVARTVSFSGMSLTWTRLSTLLWDMMTWCWSFSGGSRKKVSSGLDVLSPLRCGHQLTRGVEAWLVAALLMLSPFDSCLSLESYPLSCLPSSCSWFIVGLWHCPQKHCPVVSMLTKQIHLMLSGSMVTLNCFHSPVSLFLNGSFKINCTNY